MTTTPHDLDLVERYEQELDELVRTHEAKERELRARIEQLERDYLNLLDEIKALRRKR